MAVRHILHYPDPRLRNKALPVTEVTDEIKTLVADMFETMYDDDGIGLAAPQVDVAKRVIVIDLSEDRSEPLCFINPELISTDNIGRMQEGCLSIPNVYEYVERAQKIKVKALDRHGKPFELEAEGLLAVCIQHEIDHLNGKLFIDHLSLLKQQRIQNKLKKLRRHIL